MSKTTFTRGRARRIGFNRAAATSGRLTTAARNRLVFIKRRSSSALPDLSPLLVELLVVDDLIALESGARVRARGRALVVHDARERLVYDLVAERADAHADVSVLVVCGRVATVEAAEAFKQIFADE